MPLAAGTRLGPYELRGVLGAGGMGIVYRARDTRLDRDVAVKVLPEAFADDPDRLRRFEQEARAVAALNHPNIVTIHDVGTHDGAPFVVTEVLEGETLRQQLARGPLPLRKAVQQAIEVATGLAAAHDQGVVHRDIKPENLFVTASGRVKILDFGLARRGTGANVDGGNLPTVTRDTSPGVVLGTVGYMSPEQIRGLPADQRSDVFSLGCVLYETLSGRRAFAHATTAETMAAILREDPPPLAVTGRPLPRALERTLQRCLEKDPAERNGFAVKVVDRSGNTQTLSGGWEDWYDLVWSPDAREVWFGASRPCAGLTSSLFAVDLEGQVRSLLAAPGVLDIHDVGKDGRLLAAQPTSLHGETRVWMADATAERDISWLAYSWPVGFTPDGRAAVLNSYGCLGRQNSASGAVFLRPLDGSPPLKLADGFANGALSPDGRWLLVDGPGRLSIVPTGPGTARVWDLGFETPPTLASRSWLPDGHHVVVAATEPAGMTSLRVIDVRDGRQRSVSRPFDADVLVNAHNWLSPVSPDGRVVAVKSPGGLLLVPLDGGPIQSLKGSGANEVGVEWSPDARDLFAYEPGVIPARIVRVEVATGRRTPWKELRPPEVSAPGVGAVVMTRDGRLGAYGYSTSSVDLYLVTGVR